MVFSSITFLFYFLPIFLAVYLLTPTVKAKNVVSLLFSLLFYAWGEPRFVLILLFSIAFNYDPDAAPATTIEQWIPAAYLPVDKPGTGFNARMHTLDDHWFKPLRDSVLGALKTQQADIWYYSFEWDREPPPFNEIFGAAHAFDLPFAFGNFGPSIWANFTFTKANRPGRVALSDAMMRSIGAFARNGDPNDASLGVAWPAWPKTLVFDATLKDKAIRVR